MSETSGEIWAERFAEGIRGPTPGLNEQLEKTREAVVRWAREQPRYKRLRIGPLTIVVAQPIKVFWR